MSFSGKSSLFVIVILAFALLGFLAELVYAVPDNGPAPCILQVTGTDAEIMTSPASNVTVTLLGAEYTGTVDAYIDVGAGTQLLWLNAATQIGENYTTHVNDGTAVRLRGTGNPGLTVWSDEAGIQVEVLRNGDTLPTYAPYLSQASFGTILGPYLVNGTVVLAPNQAIVIWELGGTDVNSPAFDFQDLVLLVTLDCDTFCGDDYVQTPNDYGQTEECDGGDFCSNECTLIEVEGCTYSQGYWKNHPGAWPPVEGEYGWFNVTTMQTPPAGNAWYILAHQYIAAVLNRESGATVPNSVATAIAQSKVLLGSDVYEIGPGHLNRTQATDLADILDDYNNGLAGVPHCGEQQPEPQNMTIIATKIVCSNEADLPNWGKGGPDVTATTAADFLAQHPNCWLAPDWLFQWGNQNAANPGDNTGAAGGAWNSFGPTDANGIATVIMNNLSGVSEIHVREAFQQGYINFTYNMYGNNEHNVSAEIYCDKDVLNYDNYDFIRNPALNHTYYCVAWNVQERVCEPEEELVMNGAFEVPVVTHNAKWDIYADGTPGLEWRVEWQTNITSYSGNDRPEVANLELHRGVNSWLPANGMQHAELDTDWTGPNGALNGEPASVRIYEDIDTIPGETYRVRLAFSPRPGTGSADNVLEVKAGGAVLDTISAAGAGNTVWTYYEYDFIAASATTRLQLTDLGTPNSLGTFVDDVSMKCIEPQEPEPYCGDGEVNQESEECDDGNEVNGDGCSTRCTLEDVTIIAHKIVCDNEEDLPNWGAGPDVTITSETAADWVEEHEGCSLVEGWKFQWGINYPELQFPAGNSGEAGEPWTTITTGEGGYASATVELGDVSNIALREVPQEGYIPFSLNSEDDFSAEFYCHTDVLGYDNQELVGSPYNELEDGETYYCVAWNVPVEARPFCGDGEVNTENEQCDDGNEINGDGCSSQCTNENYTCFAKFNYDDVVNFGAGNADDLVSVGPYAQPYGASELVPLGYSDGGRVWTAPGLVMERGNGWFVVGLYSEPDQYYERIWGSLQLVNASVTSVVSLNGVEIVEHPFDGIIENTTVNDELNFAYNGSWVDHFLSVLPYEDAYNVSYVCGEPCVKKTLKYKEGSWWANSIVNTTQGKMKNGSDVPAIRSNASSALGPAQGNGSQYDDPGQTPLGSFYSLGFGGEIILSSGSRYVINGPGNDVQVYETTWSPPGYPLEKLRVYASQYGLSWVELGEIERDGAVDLGSLEWAKYIKIVDTSNQSLFDGSGDAYDLDAVKALYLADVLEYGCDDVQEGEPFCGDGEVNQQSEQCDDGNEINGDGCSTRCTTEEVTIIAHKIVCDNEEDLPNWAYNSEATINAQTAADWVEEHEGCSLVEGWKFQWGINYPELQFPAGNSGEAGEPWTTITTGEGGYASATVELGDVSNIALREVPQEGYIPFSLNSEDDFSAEFYCHTDVLGYDNQELVGSPYNELEDGETYYCVAWNVPVGNDGGNGDPAPFGPSGGSGNGGSNCRDGSCETRDSGPLLLGITPAPPGYDGGQGGSGGSGGSGAGNGYEGEGDSGSPPTEETDELLGGTPGEEEGNCALLPGGCPTAPEGSVTQLEEEFEVVETTPPAGNGAPSAYFLSGNAPWLLGLGSGLFLLLFFLFALRRRKKEED